MRPGVPVMKGNTTKIVDFIVECLIGRTLYRSKAEADNQLRSSGKREEEVAAPRLWGLFRLRFQGRGFTRLETRFCKK
jgi:hypothetical protein